MAWIESHIDLGDHPKVTELCFQLMIKKHEAIGHLHLLWHFTMKYAWNDGDLRRFTPRVICQAVGWDKDADTFINALRETGWIEKDTLSIHDWFEYAGKLVRDRRYNEERRKAALNGVIPRKSTATLPNPTLPETKDIVGQPPAASGPTAQDLMQLWNKSAHGNLPRVKFLTEARKRQAQCRLKEYPSQEFWEGVLAKVNRSPLLRGEKGSWKASFDWILNPTNLTKVIEGNYEQN